jgi:hypothetical protein
LGWSDRFKSDNKDERYDCIHNDIVGGGGDFEVDDESRVVGGLEGLEEEDVRVRGAEEGNIDPCIVDFDDEIGLTGKVIGEINLFDLETTAASDLLISELTDDFA